MISNLKVGEYYWFEDIGADCYVIDRYLYTKPSIFVKDNISYCTLNRTYRYIEPINIEKKLLANLLPKKELTKITKLNELVNSLENGVTYKFTSSKGEFVIFMLASKQDKLLLNSDLNFDQKFYIWEDNLIVSDKGEAFYFKEITPYDANNNIKRITTT